MRTLTCYVVLLAVGALCREAYAFASQMQLTPSNTVSSVQVKVTRQDSGSVQFRVLVTVPKDATPSGGLSGFLEVFDHGKLIVSHSFANLRPSAPSKYVDLPRTALQTAIQFTVNGDYIPGSKFTVVLSEPDSSAMERYWFYLRDFVTQP